MISDLEKQLKIYLNDDVFLVKLFDALCTNFYDLTNPLRFNNFAYSMRELLRLFFDKHAPDNEIITCSWHKDEKRVTRRHRFHYYLLGGVEDSMLPKEVVDSKNKKITALIERIDELSKFTHIQEDTFNLSEDECNDKHERIFEEITEILETALTLRQELGDSIHDNICHVVEQQLTEYIPADVDLLSTHSTVEEVTDIEFVIKKICSDRIFIEGSGSLGCDLQFGSNSDLKNGDGVQDSISLPMVFEGELPISNIKDGDEFEFRVQVDTSEWYGDQDYDDYII